MILFFSERFADHLTPPGHPERVERAEVMQVVAAEWRRRGGAVDEPEPATDDQILRVHGAEHLALIREVAGRAVALDPDTVTSPDTCEVARRGARVAGGAGDAVLERRAP